MNIKYFWYFMMGDTVFLFIALLIVGGYIYPDDFLMSLVPFFVLLIIHMSEIVISKKIAEDRNISFLKTFVMTTIFGFTWWVPLKRGII